MVTSKPKKAIFGLKEETAFEYRKQVLREIIKELRQKEFDNINVYLGKGIGQVLLVRGA